MIQIHSDSDVLSSVCDVNESFYCDLVNTVCNLFSGLSCKTPVAAGDLKDWRGQEENQHTASNYIIVPHLMKSEGWGAILYANKTICF